MKGLVKKYVVFMVAVICCIYFLPLGVNANELPVLDDYNNLPENYQAMGFEDEERSVKGSNSQLLVITEKVRDLTNEYTRDVFYDFTNLPDDSRFGSLKIQEFENRNGRIVQSPGAVMYICYTDKITGTEEFLRHYELITDEEYAGRGSENTPDIFEIDTIGKYRAVHAIIPHGGDEGYFQNDNWFIPLPTSLPHYGTVYLKLVVSNDVRIYGDVKATEIPVIYEQWLEECLKTTEDWTNQLLKANYTVRAEDFVEGPIGDLWTSANDVPNPSEEPQPQDEIMPANEPGVREITGDKEPVEEPMPEKESAMPEDNGNPVNKADERNAVNNKPDDYADPTEAAIISIISILLAILFGNTGGFVPPVSTGVGSPTGKRPSPTGDLGPWIKPDDAGDLVTNDPVSGERRSFANNGDGTYTDPVSGATYTPEELFEQMEHRADNADIIRQDEAQFKKNVDEDSKRNRELSEESKRLEEDLQRKQEEQAHRERVERLAYELGMNGASEDEVREELTRRMKRDEDFRQKMHDYANRQDMAVGTLETMVDIADYTMAAGEAVVPGGKVVSATYKGVKNIGETVMEKGASMGSVVEGALKGGTEAATTMMNAGIGKAGVTIGGTMAGEVASAVNDGKDVGEAIKEGFIKGAGNAAVEAVGDAIGDVAGGEGLLNKVAEAAEKIGETAYGKEIVAPNIKEKFGDK